MNAWLARWWALPVFFVTGACATPSAAPRASESRRAIPAAWATASGGGSGPSTEATDAVSHELAALAPDVTRQTTPAETPPPADEADRAPSPPRHFDPFPYPSRWFTLEKVPSEVLPIDETPGLKETLGAPYEINEPYDPINPYRQSWLKGDFPIPGTEDLFLQLTATEHLHVEDRRVPTPSGITGSTSVDPNFFGDSHQVFLRNDVAVTFDLFKSPQAFRPVEWRLRVTPVFDYTRLSVGETGVVNVDVNEGTIRNTDDLALQEAVFEYHLFDLDDRFDFVSSEIGILPFRSDFRGFIFDDTQLGVRLFGNADENKWQYNLVYFDMLDKDTNSDLNKLEDRDQEVVIANLYRQDWPVVGYTTSASFHFNHDHRGQEFDDNGFLVSPAPVGLAEEHDISAYYLGWAGEGHLGPFNITHALYEVLGHDTDNPFAGRPVGINAQLLAAELSYDMDWVRLRGYGMYASGDSDTTNGSATGFDAIVDAANFAGGQFSYFNNQGIKLLGTNLTNPGSFLPDLQTSKFQGQANFVNPGLELIGAAFDCEITPTIRQQVGVNYLRFANTDSLETYLEISEVEREIGVEFFSGTEYRPFLTNNLIFLIGLSALLPGAGIERIYQSDETLYQIVLDVTITW